MENHPIPQDITGFQFKLIGNMTIKQFAYLATGVVLAWVTFSMPISFLIKAPLTTIFALVGASFAFLPIEGRPLDIMIGNFIKALSSSTQYVYRKQGANLYFPEMVHGAQLASITAVPKKDLNDESKLKNFLASLPSMPKNKLDEKEMAFLQTMPVLPIANASPAQQQGAHVNFPNFSSFFNKGQSTPQSVQKADNAPLLKPEITENKDDTLQAQAEAIKIKLADAKKQEASQSLNTKEQEEAHQRVVNLEGLLNEAVSQRQKLENQLIELQKKLEQQNKQVFTPSIATPQDNPQQTKRVRSIPKEMSKSVGLPIASEFPNVITGIVKDPRNNPLPGILVEVKDNEGNPIRAFKTSPLGQFASATPLSNGAYTIDFEDPNKKNRFDTIGFTASGQVILPIEVISIDEREDLRKTLFGQ